jgi:hypothetical protein
MLSFGEVFSEAAASIWKLFERGNGIARRTNRFQSIS